MLTKLISLFFKTEQKKEDPFMFCQPRETLIHELEKREIEEDVDSYVAERIVDNLIELIQYDSFDKEKLDLLISLAKECKCQSDHLTFYVDKAIIKFDIQEDYKTFRRTDLTYPDTLSFTIDNNEAAVWQWKNISILASSRSLIIGKDVNTSCGCVSKVRDCLNTSIDKEQLKRPDVLNFSRLDGNDILITNRHLYIKSSRSYDKIEHEKLTLKYIDSKGFAVSTEELKGRVLIFLIHDPLFMDLLLSERKGIALSY